MIRGLTITFESLERFNEHVVVDIGRPLTAIVGPNGSGKSTILEAVAEVMMFLHQAPIEAPVDHVRKRIQVQRSAQPSWTRAQIQVDLHDDTSLAIGETLAKHLGDVRRGGQISIGVSKRPAAGGARWVAESVTYFDKSIAFDTNSSIIVDSVRLSQARAELNHLEEEHNSKIASLQNQLQAQNNTSPRKPALIEKLTADLAQAEALRNSPEVEARRRRLQQEIQESKNGAIRTAEGGEVSKREVEALRASIGMPAVIYLQGWPDIAARIKQLTDVLGALKDKPRSERANSPYNQMCARLYEFLHMDVTIGRHDSHVLLIDDRPVAEVSLGTWLALGFAAICEETDDNVLVIWDEPETGLHPTWARKVCDMMQQKSRRFLIATHRTEFVPAHSAAARVYKTLARAREHGEKVICSLQEATGLLHAYSIAASLGMEPSCILFTANAVIWVEGPSDLIYWRFWLRAMAEERKLDLVEGFDYCFMFSGGSLLANETMASESAEIGPDTVNLLRIVGASLVIVDTDFNPDDPQRSRISREKLQQLCATNVPKNSGFVFDECRDFLKPRVRALLAAIDSLGATDNLSTAINTWGREAENGLTDESFRRTVNKIFEIKDGEADAAIIDKLEIESWRSFDEEIKASLAPHCGDPALKKLWTKNHDGKEIVAQMSVIRDKTRFAQTYAEVTKDAGLSSVRSELRQIIGFVFDWIIKVKESYCQ